MVHRAGCQSGEFMCADGERCIPRAAECDGQINCPDRSDEHANCSKFHFLNLKRERERDLKGTSVFALEITCYTCTCI